MKTSLDQNLYVTPHQSVGEAIDLMAMYKVEQLPVVDLNKNYVGLLLEEELSFASLDEPISIANIKKLKEQVDNHPLNYLREMLENKVDVLPIVSEHNTFVGAVIITELLKDLSLHYSLSDPGSILIVQLGQKESSISDLIRVVESENLHLLSCLVHKDHNGPIEVTIKVNELDISGLIKTLNRYDFTVISYFSSNESQGALQDHYDHLMNYLNV